MADQYLQAAPDSTGKKIDTEELTVGANTVQRQRVVLCGVGATDISDFATSAPAGTEQGLITRNIPSGTQTVDGTVLLGAGTAAVGKLAANDAVDIGDVTVNNDATAGVYVRPGTASTWELAASGNVIGNVGLVPATDGGLAVHRILSAATTNAVCPKASAGQVYGWYITNVNASVMFVKLYDKASAPTVGSDAPVITLPIATMAAGGAVVAMFPQGIEFTTGIALAITGLVADSDTTAVAADEIVVNLFYK